MSKHLRNFYARSNVIIRKFHHCSIEVKCELFRSYRVPTYCSHLWVHYNKCTYSKLRIAYNNMYRRLFGLRKYDSASFMYALNNVDNLDTVIRNTCMVLVRGLRYFVSTKKCLAAPPPPPLNTSLNMVNIIIHDHAMIFLVLSEKRCYMWKIYIGLWTIMAEHLLSYLY